MVTIGHTRVTIGHLRVTITIGHLRVTLGHFRLTTGCSQTSCKFLRPVTQSFFGLFPVLGLFLTIQFGRFFILVLLGHEIEKKG